ncbi:MAG TPA: cytochrome d ubiquinol oxidase subunit II [Nitrospirales bacterium]|nr:cytochrome d ubiquinol oxidase subunit II [Nitrospirales bacterium]
MPGLEEIIAGCIVISLTLYALLGGADYGAGIWYLLARGPEAQTQRHLISTAIGPIWEANHVWLILVITLLFSAFPLAYARISTVLHIPLTLLLTGIVLRGSAFAFRSYDVQQSPLHRFWGTLFGLSSLITAMFLGIILGTLTSSYLQNVQGGFVDVFVLPWIQPFPLAVGIWTITLFAFLASTYLIHETPLPALRGLYRRKALWSLAASAIMAILTLLLTKSYASEISQGLLQSPTGWVFLILALLGMLASIIGLWTKRFHLARISAVGYVTAIIWGWGFGQYPYLIKPDLTIFNTTAPASTLELLLFALVAGMIVVLPSLLYLFRVFKKIQV